MSFTHKQGRFEGPYHKLLELIEQRKLSINEISLALIADEYIDYISKLRDSGDENREENLKDDISQFIVVASTLMIIKAKSLLPTLEYTGEEKAEIANLEYKLNLYKILIDGSRAIKKLWSKRNYAKARMRIDIIVFAPGNVRHITLQSVSILTMAKLPHLERLKSVAVAQSIKIETIIESIIQRISHIKGSISFADIFQSIYQDYKKIKELSAQHNQNLNHKISELENEEKTYKIVSFLGILDLIRNGHIEASQDNGEEIIIHTKATKVVENAQ